MAATAIPATGFTTRRSPSPHEFILRPRSRADRGAGAARERKATTSYVQRRLEIGYNRAARIIERMEEEGVISKPNHQGKREVLLPEGRE